MALQDISGFGLVVNISASKTFPAGFRVTEFADDADPLDLPSIQVKDKGMGLNGTLVTWSKANPVPMTLNVIPGSEEDKNLTILLQANRPGVGRRPANDVINATVIYGDGTSVRLISGVITDGPLGSAVASAGRKKSKGYIFAFAAAQ